MCGNESNENYDIEESSYNDDEQYEEYEPNEEQELSSENYDQKNSDLNESFQLADDNDLNELNNDLIEEEPDYYNEPADKGFLNIDDPFNKVKIQTQKEQHEFLTKYTEAVLKKAGLPSSYLDYRIKTHPVVSAATKIIERYETELSNIRFTNELNELKELVPTIEKMDDLFKINNFNQFFKNYFGIIKIDKEGKLIGKVTPKMTMKEAYVLANYNTLMKDKTKAGKQALMNNLRAKRHLSIASNNKSYSSTPDIPSETLELYQHLMPDLKTKDFMKHFVKSTNKNN